MAGETRARLKVDRAEAWALHKYLRHPDPDKREWSKDVMVQIFRACLDEKDAGVLELTEEDLWQIDRQLPQDEMVGAIQLGFQLLRRVMQLILTFYDGETIRLPDSVETALENALAHKEESDARDSDASEGPDDNAGDRPVEAA